MRVRPGAVRRGAASALRLRASRCGGGWRRRCLFVRQAPTFAVQAGLWIPLQARDEHDRGNAWAIDRSGAPFGFNRDQFDVRCSGDRVSVQHDNRGGRVIGRCKADARDFRQGNAGGTEGGLHLKLGGVGQRAFDFVGADESHGDAQGANAGRCLGGFGECRFGGFCLRWNCLGGFRFRGSLGDGEAGKRSVGGDCDG